MTTLRLSDPAYTDRLSGFIESLGQRVVAREPGSVTVERDLPEAELRIYVRVWAVLHPEAPVSVG